MAIAVASQTAARSQGWVTPRDGFALALLGFAVSLALLLLVPPFLLDDIGAVPGFTGQEAIDLLTPIIAMPLFVLAVELTGRATTPVRVLLAIGVAVWVLGQGVHLAANAIGDLYAAGPERVAFYATPAGALDEFLDETLSHWLWHGAWLGLLGLLLWAGATGGVDGAAPRALASRVGGVAGIVHGFTWFVVTDIGRTWALAIPASAALLALGFLARRPDGSGQVVRWFIIAGSFTTLALYAAWIVIAGWEPVSILDRIKLL